MSTAVRSGWRLAFAVAFAASLFVLYWPRSTGGGLPHLDKVVHALMFAALAYFGLRAGVRAVVLVPLLALHAVSSELVQEHLLDGRSGDLLDLVADLLGVAGATSVFLWASWRRDRVPA